MRKLIATGATLACLWMVAPLAAAPIPVATSTGTLAIHYNVGQPETPSEQGYIKSQFSPLNTNGGALSFVPLLQPLFGDVGQFGFDMVLEAPTHDGSLDPIPFLTAFDYDGTEDPEPAGTVAWAINDYKPGVPGPGTPGNEPYNSLFRGPSVEISTSLLSVVGTVFTVEVTGKLISDGFAHWFAPAAGSTPLSAGIRNNFLFSGIFSYDSATDTTVGIDYYNGTATIFALPVPEPASATLLGMGSVFVLAGARRWRRKA